MQLSPTLQKLLHLFSLRIRPSELLRTQLIPSPIEPTRSCPDSLLSSSSNLAPEYAVNSEVLFIGSRSGEALVRHIPVIGALVSSASMDQVAKLASQKAVVIFSKSTCCMCHAVERLFYELGVSPAICELEEDSTGKEMERALARLGCSPPVPAVFIGGKFVGSANTVMTHHLNGSLKTMLKDAGALWL